MKRLLISLVMLVLPICVKAETCSGIGTDTYCNASSSSCLSSLQENYNTWNNREKHSGTSCVKVIAKYECRGGKYQSKTYLNGYDPSKNFLCSSGNAAGSSNMTLRGTGAVDADVVGDSCTSTMYVPEAWEIVCSSTGNTGNTGSSSSSNNSSGSSSNSSSNSNNNNSSNNSSNNSGNSTNKETGTGTNSKGQITGTTDNSGTGVETYFVVLISMVILAYIVLLLSKKNNVFKSI